MRPMFITFIAFVIMFVTGCASLSKNQPASTEPGTTPQPTVEVITAQGDGQAVGLPSITPDGSGGGSSPAALPANGVTLSENGKTYSMQVGESFLLNLGTDVYEWTVNIDHQDVLQRKLGVTVIKGAQGIYIAQTPGTAVLTANGDPLCLKSTPPCKMVSISFSITLIVK